jgi:excisionase family DNA binding protein
VEQPFFERNFGGFVSNNAVPREESKMSTVPDGVYTVDTAAEIVVCHRATIWREIRRNRLAAARVGTEWRITAESLRRYLDGKPPSRPNALTTTSAAL